MNKLSMMAGLSLLLANITVQAHETDSLTVVDVEEVVIAASPKENRKLREQPASTTLLSQQALRNNQVNGIKNLTSVVPNLFIPDYGSRLTSAVYIRGIGSRINTPSVGLYVDNIPYIDKSAFDFSYANVERIEVLRGPQATLYGRNAMGGLIHIHTKSPFAYQGTDLSLGAGTHSAFNGSITHYHRTNDRFAFSAGAFYDNFGGFFTNSTLNKKADKSDAAGVRLRAIYLPSDNWKLDFTVNYEGSDQGAYPYYYGDKIENNEASSYRRNLLNAGLNLEYQARHFTFSAVTGYQYLNDRMFMDQDFTKENIFNLEQKQKIHTLSEEIVLKSKPNRRHLWTTGAFAFYQSAHTDGPVTFHQEGIKKMIEDNVNNAFPNSPMAPRLHMGIRSEEFRVGGDFNTPTLSAALFHQSTLKDLFIEGLSATVGLRLDYEKLQMDYNSTATPMDFEFSMKMDAMHLDWNSGNLKGNAAYVGKEHTDYLQLLPKFALQYEWKKGNNVYASASKGYRSGGYNIQMFSDLITGVLRNSMMDEVKGAMSEDHNQMVSSMSAMVDRMKKEVPEVSEATRYKPEYTWNYEIGAHLTSGDSRLTADLSAFYMDTRDQQLSKFAESGLGRITVNAGKSRSLGVEAAFNVIVSNALSLNASYGYTQATFKEYVTNEKDEKGALVEVDYQGNYVPFVPKHTFNLGGQYTWQLKRNNYIDCIRLNANYAGAGRIYWTEKNNTSQSLYGTLNGKLSLQKKDVELSVWVRNALNKDYTAFYFESMGNGFYQKNRPVQAGVELRCRF